MKSSFWLAGRESGGLSKESGKRQKALAKDVDSLGGDGENGDFVSAEGWLNRCYDWRWADYLQKEMVPGFPTWAEGSVLSEKENNRVGADLRGKIKGSHLGMSGLDVIRVLLQRPWASLAALRNLRVPGDMKILFFEKGEREREQDRTLGMLKMEQGRQVGNEMSGGKWSQIETQVV